MNCHLCAFKENLCKTFSFSAQIPSLMVFDGLLSVIPSSWPPPLPFISSLCSVQDACTAGRHGPREQPPDLQPDTALPKLSSARLGKSHLLPQGTTRIAQQLCGYTVTAYLSASIILPQRWKAGSSEANCLTGCLSPCTGCCCHTASSGRCVCTCWRRYKSFHSWKQRVPNP